LAELSRCVVKYIDWVHAFTDLRSGGMPCCPNCHQPALSSRAFAETDAPRAGWAVVYCMECKTGVRLSRVPLAQTDPPATTSSDDSLDGVRWLY
jgi:hypothetical protein